MDKIEQTFTRFLKDDEQLSYPDFDAMWNRLENNIINQEGKLEQVGKVRARRIPLRKAAVISALVALLVAAPAIAAISYNWDSLLSYRGGIQSALEQNLGQSIGNSVTHDGVTLTVDTSIVDDNRTVLLYTLSMDNGHADSLRFSEMNLQDGEGRVIEGRQTQLWDEASQMWKGYFETDWTPDGQETDVRFTARNLQSFSSVERDISFNPLDTQKQTFTIQQDGIDQLTVQPFVQGDKTLLATEVIFDKPATMLWANPRVYVTKERLGIQEVGAGVFGTPGEQGEYTGQQLFRTSDLQQDTVNYKLIYTLEEQLIDKDWNLSVNLDKSQMLSGTVTRELNIPVEHLGEKMVVKQLTATPTQIRLKVNHDRYERFPFMDYALEVNGTVLNGHIQDMGEYETNFIFEVTGGLFVNEQTPITLVAGHEVMEHMDAKEPILLKDISEEKNTITTIVGGYSVTWTYYKQDGNLFVQSESADPSFGGVNQTFMRPNEGGLLDFAKVVTSNFLGDGNNHTIDMYPNYSSNEAEIYIYLYYLENLHQQLRVDLNG